MRELVLGSHCDFTQRLSGLRASWKRQHISSIVSGMIIFGWLSIIMRAVKGGSWQARPLARRPGRGATSRRLGHCRVIERLNTRTDVGHTR